MPFVDETLHILLRRLFNRQAWDALVYEKTLPKKFHSLRGGLVDKELYNLLHSFRRGVWMDE
jgi:hypothetical protein